MIEKIEIKLNKLKKKVNKKVLNVAIFMTFGALIIFSLEMTNNFKRQKNLVQDEYNKSMYLAVSYINNVEDHQEYPQSTWSFPVLRYSAQRLVVLKVDASPHD